MITTWHRKIIRFTLAVALSCGACFGLGAFAFGSDLSSISNADASAALKKALDQGVERAVGELGAVDGFLKNPKVKIDLPPKLAKAEGMMKMLGLGEQVDQLVTAMNRAAEAAVPESKVAETSPETNERRGRQADSYRG
jgi:hypothetical protein